MSANVKTLAMRRQRRQAIHRICSQCFWVRGRNVVEVRFLCVNRYFYSPTGDFKGYESHMLRLGHKRYPRGRRVSSPSASYVKQLPVNQWVQVI